MVYAKYRGERPKMMFAGIGKLSSSQCKFYKRIGPFWFTAIFTVQVCILAIAFALLVFFPLMADDELPAWKFILGGLPFSVIGGIGLGRSYWEDNLIDPEEPGK